MSSETIAWLVLGVLAGGLAASVFLCVRSSAAHARAPRDATERAGPYSIPYVMRLRGWKVVLALILVVDAGLAFVELRAGPGTPVLPIFNLAALGLLWLVSRYEVTLGSDALRFRHFLREHVISYDDVASVAPQWLVFATGRGVGVSVVVRIGLIGGRGAVNVPVSMLSGRDRAILVDHLQRCARHATFAPNVHELWTGTF